MNSVSKKRTSATTKPADARILAQAAQEEAGTEPESGVHEAADPIDGVPEGEDEDGSPESMACWSAKRKAFHDQPLTITLGEACDLVGRDLEPTKFQEQVFDVIARELDTLSDLAENQGGFEGWAAFQNLRSRILLAGKIAAVIGGTP